MIKSGGPAGAQGECRDGALGCLAGAEKTAGRRVKPAVRGRLGRVFRPGRAVLVLPGGAVLWFFWFYFVFFFFFFAACGTEFFPRSHHDLRA